MFKICATFLFCLVFAQPLFAQEDRVEDDVPYVYYYSDVLKGIVIERADGTDSRVLAPGGVDEDVIFVAGSGWSLERSWFAWSIEVDSGVPYPPTRLDRAYAVNRDGDTTLEMLNDFPCVFAMYWHPTENILLVFGEVEVETCTSNLPDIATYWLIDVDHQSLLAKFSIQRSSDYLDPIVFWREEEQMVQFGEGIDALEQGQLIMHSFLVTMHFGGTVTMEPMLYENLFHMRDLFTPDYPDHQDEQEIPFLYWDDHPEARLLEVPPAGDHRGSPCASLQHPTSEWVLVGHEWCTAGCSTIGTVSVFNPATGVNREVAHCGGHPACIGWLPEDFAQDDLPPGSPTSVLPG